MKAPSDIITMDLEGAPPPFADTIALGDDGRRTSPSPVRWRIGRFIVKGELGRGAMGTVVEAHDETLARTVALKLLHGRVDEVNRDRLLREAQALAQLSHPNVVQVYEVGLVEDQMFIAMELVEGQTLRRWQRQRRPWQEVVDVYLQAGRGLAAAHARGLVHRDFKPENCIIGDNGRVRVLDFGLARGAQAPDEPSPAHASKLEGSPLQLRMTQSGRVMGTLGYLPLRQIMGTRADARSDQFSFCVSLYEALYGVLPFPIDSLATLVEALRSGPPRTPPRGVRVPRRLWRILLRGLSEDPDARWPTMDALLGEMERLRAPRRWPLVATLVLGFGAGGLAVAGSRPEPCADSLHALDDTWGPSEREAIEAAYLASGHVDALRWSERAEAALDAYAEDWVEHHQQACRATFVTHEHSEAAYERTMLCLQRHQGQLRAAIEALAEVSSAEEALERTVLPFQLQSLGACEDLEATAPSLALPAEPTQQVQVVELRREIDRANALGKAGTLAPALEAALAAVERAREVGYDAMLAEALETLGRLQIMAVQGPAAEATLLEAIMVSARAKDDTLMARAWSSLVYAVMLQDDLDRGLSLRFSATAAVERAGDPVARGWLLNNLGSLHGQRGELALARQHFEQALAVKVDTLGSEHFETAIALYNLGVAFKEERRLDEARQALERARAIVLATVGDDHPYMAFVETGLGHVRQVQWDLGSAAEHHARALAIRERAFGPDHIQVAKSLEYLGKTKLWQGELDEAVRVLQRAIDIYQRALGPNASHATTVAIWLAEAELRRGRTQQARELAERSLARLEEKGWPEERARARFVLGRALEPDPDQRARARALVEQALEDLEGSTERAEAEAWLRSHPLPEAAPEPPPAAEAEPVAPPRP